MIQVFCIQFVGEPLLLHESEFGFFRNEYVLALSEGRAIEIARARVMKRLERKKIRFIEGSPFTLQVESVKPGMPIWRIFRNEGFLFFPVEE